MTKESPASIPSSRWLRQAQPARACGIGEPLAVAELVEAELVEAELVEAELVEANGG